MCEDYEQASVKHRHTKWSSNQHTDVQSHWQRGSILNHPAQLLITKILISDQILSVPKLPYRLLPKGFCPRPLLILLQMLLPWGHFPFSFIHTSKVKSQLQRTCGNVFRSKFIRLYPLSMCFIIYYSWLNKAVQTLKISSSMYFSSLAPITVTDFFLLIRLKRKQK